MDPFETFEQHLRDALAHLYSPTYQPPEIIWAVAGCHPQQGVESVQRALIRAIDDLKPLPNVPSNARIRRIYELLSWRYVRSLTQEETAERLGITPRHLRREQEQAVHVLARHIWEQSRLETPLVDELAHEKGTQPPEVAQSAEWHSQVKQELASLEKSAPGTVADVGEAIRGVVELGSALTSRHSVSLDMERIQPGLIAALHPSALRQILIKGIGKLVQHMSSGRITLGAQRDVGQVKISITGCPATADIPPSSDLIREILATQGGSVAVSMDNDRISFWVGLPSAEEITVLVVDDNTDLVHFYRRYTTGTKYRIIHIREGQRALEALTTSVPDIIVLDVMLPDVDGWELLAQLRKHPAIRSIPIVVCSVVREEELALALGAALYLPKPVRRQQFIRALDQALNQAATSVPRVRASNTVAC